MICVLRLIFTYFNVYTVKINQIFPFSNDKGIGDTRINVISLFCVCIYESHCSSITYSYDARQAKIVI